MNKSQPTPTRSNTYEQKPRPYPYSKDIQGYQKAVWDFLLEHSDVKESGAIFVKFHTSGKDNFEKRVLARWHYGYHRENTDEKGAKQEELRKQYTERKIEKELKWERYKEERKRHYKAQERKKKIETFMRPLLRIISALRPRGKDNDKSLLPGKETH